jgi:NAD(P)-dependent dehydrogenase (short-subunit alcohol dehydrogenase family)
MDSTFTGKTVLITGANGALGQAVVARFAAAGANLALAEHRAGGLDALMARLNVPAERYLALTADATDPASTDAAVAQVAARFGQIDSLAHTVGGYSAGEPVHESGLDVWDRMMALNARAVYVTCGAAARHMLERGVHGSMVVVLARAALTGSKNQAAYTASKAAAQRVVESMAAELLPHSIRVNAVLPGTIDTPANRESMPKADFSKWVPPAQIADVILFLAGDAAAAVSGASVPVYGRS